LALRRTLLVESFILCGVGAAIGVAAARPVVDGLARYAVRFSVRALDLRLDPGALWVAAALAMASAVFLAFIPRLPSAESLHGSGLTGAGSRTTGGASGRLRVFAVVQIAASFVLLVGAAMLLRTLLQLQAAEPGIETRQVLAVDLPVIAYGRTPEQIRLFYREVQRRISAVPSVERVSVGSSTPWRDTRDFDLAFTFAVEGGQQLNGDASPRAKLRRVSPGYFETLGVDIHAGRDFSDSDRDGAERVVIISQSVADQLFLWQSPLDRHLVWTDAVMRVIGVSQAPHRIVGVVPDIDDENVIPLPSMLVYHPYEQQIAGGRLFVNTKGDPYSLIPTITQIVRELSADQPVEHPNTLHDIRAEVLSPDRLNVLVFGGFAAVALAVSIVGVAGVLAFSVSARTREFGVRLAIGSPPHHLLRQVLGEGLLLAGTGMVVGALGILAIRRIAGSFIANMAWPGMWPILGSVVVLFFAGGVAAALPAIRAARIDVITALRSE